MKRFGNGHNHGKFRAVRWIQIKKEVVRMIEIVITIGPWVVVDAAQARQEKQGSAVAGRRELNDFTAMFRIYRNCLEPVRQAFAYVLLKKSLSLDSVGVASQNQSPVA